MAEGSPCLGRDLKMFWVTYFVMPVFVVTTVSGNNNRTTQKQKQLQK
jgi:hypothetical protein